MTIGRLAVRAPNWLGDAVMALPAIASLRAAHPSASLTIAAAAPVAPLFLEPTNAAPNDVLTISGSKEEASLLRAGGFDAVVLLPNSFRTAWAARRAGIPERWGYATGFRGWTLTRAPHAPSAKVHQSLYYQELVTRLGFAPTNATPAVDPSPATRARAAGLLADRGYVAGDRPAPRLVGLAPGAAYGHAKRWPPDRVAQLVTRLAADQGARCVLVGATGDAPAGREIEAAVEPAAGLINLIGRTDLRQLTGVLAACDAFVANDSGAMHLAAAVGVPVVAIFGPTDERVTSPLGEHDILIHQVFCRPCMLRDCPIDHRCMRGISVDTVFSAVSRRLGDAS